MDDIPICPPWWPNLLWRLHFPVKVPGHGPGPGPVNYPPIVEDMMANLHIHTMSYLMMDQGEAQKIRSVAEGRLVHAAQNLSNYHNQAIEK